MLCLSAGKAGGVTSLHTLPRLTNVWNVAWCEVSLGMLMRRIARSIGARRYANTALPLESLSESVITTILPTKLEPRAKPLSPTEVSAC